MAVFCAVQFIDLLMFNSDLLMIYCTSAVITQILLLCAVFRLKAMWITLLEIVLLIQIIVLSLIYQKQKDMTITNELNWMIKAAKITKEYAECIEKKFTGKLPYRMVMNAILNNSWTNKSENNTYWNVSNTDSDKINYSLHYTMKTGIVEFTIYEAK